MELVKLLNGFLCKKFVKQWKVVKKYPLEEIMHIDEFIVGGMEEGKQGRSYDTKNKKSCYIIIIN